MGEATTAAGVRSFGVSYGLYNLAWGAGLLSGPALGGFLFERLGFWRLMLVWAPMLIAVRGDSRGSGRAGRAGRAEGGKGRKGRKGGKGRKGRKGRKGNKGRWVESTYELAVQRRTDALRV
jgi:MFS family permease